MNRTIGQYDLGLYTRDLKLYEYDANTLSLENLAGGTYKYLSLGRLQSGPTNGNTLILYANDTPFITLTTGVTDTCKIVNDIDTDRWLVSSTSFSTYFGIGVAGNSGISHAAGDQGYFNTFVGYCAGYKITSGYHNTFFGSRAGEEVTTENSNTLIGACAGNGVKSSGNTFVGSWAGIEAVGDSDTFIGAMAGDYATGAVNSVFVGWCAGQGNSVTKGTGDNNVFIGWSAGVNFTTAQRNVVVGCDALSDGAMTSAQENVIIGFQAGKGMLTGYDNVLIGMLAGDSITTGSSNIIIGYDQDTPAVNSTRKLNIGGLITGDLPGGGSTPNIVLPAAYLWMSQTTEPAATADRAGIYALDIAAGHCALGISSEEVVVVGVAVASTHKYPVRINGATYNILLSNA